MNLLIQESPLLILPTLAQAIGLDEAILLQQLHFRLKHQGQERDGKLWYCQTYTKWAKQLPFWGESKIKRLFLKLESLGPIQSTDKYNTFLSIARNGIRLSTLRSIRFFMPSQM